MPKPKILFCSKSYPIYGGVERWLSDLCEYLPKLGYEPIVALAQGARFNDPLAYKAAYPHLQTVSMKSLTGSAMGRRIAAESIIKKVRPDIVIPVMVHDALIGAVSLKSSGGQFRIVYPIHELNPGVFKAVKIFAQDIDMSVCVNQLSLKICQALSRIPTDRVRHIRCGVPLPVKEKMQRIDSIFHVGYVGRIERIQKRIFDLKVLCQELERMKIPYRLSIAGRGSAEEELKHQLKDYVLNGKIIFKGQMSAQQLYTDFYPSIDALIITSEWETGPLVAWEAMANGVVVVTSCFHGLKIEHILRHKENALVYEIGDMSQAADHILDLWADKRLCEKLGQTGKQTVQASLTLERMIQDWAGVFSAVLKEHSITSGDEPSVPSSPGRLEKWGVPRRIGEYIRRITCRRFEHTSVRAEWPHYPQTDGDFNKHFNEVLYGIEASLPNNDIKSTTS